jgi:hypothetical protein
MADEDGFWSAQPPWGSATATEAGAGLLSSDAMGCCPAPATEVGAGLLSGDPMECCSALTSVLGESCAKRRSR